MKSDRQTPVAIIGGGFSGTLLAAQLARRGIASLLIEAAGEGRAGCGTAYSTDEPVHLLNVRAEGMSAWPDEPDHFARAFAAEGGDPRGFAERRLFGRYLRSILDDAASSGKVTVLAARAIAALPAQGGWKLALADGSTVEAGDLVLANGNEPPETPSFAAAAGLRFVNNPWSREAKAAVASAAENGGDVMLIGTGLTMIDMVLSLAAAGHQGSVLALSRRGLVPKPHSEFAPSPVSAADLPRGNLRDLAGWLRRRSGEVGWRAAVDSLRPHTQALWQSLDGDQQRRFLRHARPWWDVHRHRIAPQVSRQLAEAIAQGQVEIAAGRIVRLSEEGGGIGATIRRRSRERSEERHFAYVFNCTGPLGAIARTEDPLLRSLLDQGLARPDRLGLGIDVDERSTVVGAERLWALGPLTRGRYWEIVAVPDIRVQAAAVAQHIATELGQ